MGTYYRVKLDVEDAEQFISDPMVGYHKLDIEHLGGGVLEMDTDALDYFRGIDPDLDGTVTDGGDEDGVPQPPQMWVGGIGHPLKRIEDPPETPSYTGIISDDTAGGRLAVQVVLDDFGGWADAGGQDCGVDHPEARPVWLPGTDIVFERIGIHPGAGTAYWAPGYEALKAAGWVPGDGWCTVDHGEAGPVLRAG